ncbi:MAG: family 78 glycoside hydrolase catalytic domain [Clostridia bacterium]|nr:family 78 glycoside hydrolase catalytic domain [Clostridia bacterium]
MRITDFTVENLSSGCVTDSQAPRFSFKAESEVKGAYIQEAEITVNGWDYKGTDQILVPYDGKKLEPFKEYRARLRVTDNANEEATAEVAFRTGRLETPWQAKWITDSSYVFKDKKVSPVPMTFRKQAALGKKVKSAYMYATAIGLYVVDINGQQAGDIYLNPGFTSYKHTLQYQTYDVTRLLKENNDIVVSVAGGWAVGAFVFTRKNRITAPRQALLLEIRIAYEDGTEEVIGTDSSWDVSMDGPFRAACIYDGETYDATVDLNAIRWEKAGIEKLKIKPRIVAGFGDPIRAHEVFRPVKVTHAGGETIYDLGQNFAGVIRARIKNGKAGQTVTFRHAEVLDKDGTLFTEILRSAKATATYVCRDAKDCRDGVQTYSPRLTYMGFRYVGVSGIADEDLELEGLALYSDMKRTGTFKCSDPLINKLNENILWGAKSNLMDLPTDCPQRDERMGWTGDIALFAPTASFNFDTSRFFDKWLNDLRAEQLRTGGVRNTVPTQGYHFPATMPGMAVDFWGDAAVLVPWAEYQARGDRKLLEKSYESMRKYVKACKFWAGLFSFGRHRYIWKNINSLHFGDWVSPDAPKMSQWQGRHKYTATASLQHTSHILSQVAKILGKEKDAQYFAKMSERTADAYVSLFTDGNGKLKKDEFQTAYVLPLAFGMFPEEQREKAAANLAALAARDGYRIATGFPGTPFILSALTDNGQPEAAFSMLTCTECPSWLYEVKAGGTTIWERWDGLNPDGSVNVPNDGTVCMISFNHYASGAVGNFLYTRIAGLEMTQPGYKEFNIKPLVGGGITSASATHESPYGTISSSWKITDGFFRLDVKIPMGTTCTVTLPDGSVHYVDSGIYAFTCTMPGCEPAPEAPAPDADEAGAEAVPAEPEADAVEGVEEPDVEAAAAWNKAAEDKQGSSAPASETPAEPAAPAKDADEPQETPEETTEGEGE